ncbi:hypothetical protein KC364_g22 [Hortaea werneckii]|nr:hypothetical protein KC364_g22 [Hortaea werneckii]
MLPIANVVSDIQEVEIDPAEVERVEIHVKSIDQTISLVIHDYYTRHRSFVFYIVGRSESKGRRGLRNADMVDLRLNMLQMLFDTGRSIRVSGVKVHHRSIVHHIARAILKGIITSSPALPPLAGCKR